MYLKYSIMKEDLGENFTMFYYILKCNVLVAKGDI